MVGQADLHGLQALPHLGPQLPCLLVVQEQGGTLGLEHARGLAHHLAQQHPDVDLRGDIGHHVQKLHLLLAQLAHALDGLHALQRQRAVAGHRRQQFQVGLGEAPLEPVDDLRHPDDLAPAGAHRHAQDAAGDETRLLIVGAVEARVGVGIMHDQALARVEHMPGDAQVVHQPDLAASAALCDARVQLPGLRIVEEQAAAFGLQLLRGDQHQRLQHFIQGLDARDLLRNAQQHLGKAQAALERGHGVRRRVARSLRRRGRPPDAKPFAGPARPCSTPGGPCGLGCAGCLHAGRARGGDARARSSCSRSSTTVCNRCRCSSCCSREAPCKACSCSWRAASRASRSAATVALS